MYPIRNLYILKYLPQNDICLGVPVVIGKNGWESIIDYKLTDAEQAEFNKSADAVRNMNEVLKTL
jgi:malate dehydrogenase